MLFSASAGSWFIGMLIWDELMFVQHIAVPFPAWSDLFFLATGPLMALAFHVYDFANPGTTITLKRLGDLGVLASAIIAISLVLYFEPATTEHSSIYAITALAYPLIYISSLLFALTSFWQRTSTSYSALMAIQLASLATHTFAGTIYGHDLLQHDYVVGSSLDIAWVATFALMIYASYEERELRAWEDPAFGQRVNAWIDSLVPTIALSVLMGVIFVYPTRLTPSLLPYLALSGLAFAFFLAVRAIASHEIEQELSKKMRAKDEQLLLGQKMRALGTLSGGIAHDFNNLLTGMMSGLEMVRSRVGDDSKTSAYLTLMDRSMQRAADLTRRLRSLSRRDPIVSGAVSPNDIIDHVAELISRGGGGGVTVVARANAPGLAMKGDEAMIEQAVLNLAINAQQAMNQQGKIELGCDCVSDTDKARFVRFWVVDNGPGIPPELQNRVFEPFFTTKSATEGTGLGLSMVYSVVQAHGGTILLDSEKGRGTRFELRIPYIPSRDRISERIVKDLDPTTRGETVLVVDDRDEPLVAAKSLLENFGYKVIAYWSALDALDRIRRSPNDIDLIVTDALMPQMSGVDLVAAAREAGYLGATVLMSGRLEDISQTSRFDQLLAKPFNATTLLTAVQNAIQRKSTDTHPHASSQSSTMQS
ncbi:MAG: ATP-binding protein [Polyangiales bacterium]